MRPGEGWVTDRKPNPLLRLRAWFALRAYRKAEKPYRRLLREIEALKAEQQAVLTSMRPIIGPAGWANTSSMYGRLT
jgi:hypothetical protein